jgi:lipopolysaccharide biosynthesis regulator YciM
MKKIYTIILSFFSLLVVSQNEQLAQNYIDKGEFDKAASLYEEMDKKQPNNFYFTQKLVACFQGLKQFSKAEKLLLNKTKPICITKKHLIL